MTAIFRKSKGNTTSAQTALLAILVVATLLLSATMGLAQKRSHRKPDNAPKVGEVAPLFVLKSLDGKSETDLAKYRGEKPVVLFFGSYT